MNKSMLLLLPIFALASACGPLGPDETGPPDPRLVTTGPSGGKPTSCSSMIDTAWTAGFDYTKESAHCSEGDRCIVLSLRLLSDGTFRRDVITTSDGFVDAANLHEEKSLGTYSLDCKDLILSGCDGAVTEYSVDAISAHGWTGSGFNFSAANGVDAEKVSDRAFAAYSRCF